MIEIILIILTTLIGGFVYLFLTLLLNFIIPEFNWGIKFKFLEKRFKDNKSPIYKLKLTKGTHIYESNTYEIRKYELKYHKDYPFWALMTIPLVVIFKIYGYRIHPFGYGNYSKRDINNSLIVDLKKTWEGQLNLDMVLINEKKRKDVEFTNVIKELNKEFADNYKI